MLNGGSIARERLATAVMMGLVGVYIAIVLSSLNDRVKVPSVDRVDSDRLIPLRATYDPAFAFGFREDERDLWQKPEQVLDALGDLSGKTVVDIGCGEGYFTLRLLDRVGPEGLVIATDIQPQLLNRLEERVDEESRDRLQIVLATETEIGVDRTADVVLLIHVLGEVEQQVSFLKQIRAIMRPESLLVVIDSKHMTNRKTGYTRPINLDLVSTRMEELGFVPIRGRELDFLPRQFFMLLRLKGPLAAE